MTSTNPVCNIYTFGFGQVLSVFILFTITTEKGLKGIVLESKHPFMSKDAFSIVLRAISKAGDQHQKHWDVDFLYQQSLHLYYVPTYLALEEYRLNLTIWLTVILRSQISDSSAKQQRLYHHCWVIGCQLTTFGLVLFNQPFLPCQVGYNIVDVTTTSLSCLTVLTIWFYRCQQVKTNGIISTSFRWAEETKRSWTFVKHIMVPSYIIVALSFLGISTIIGFVTNAFIIVAHGMDRARGRTINPRELILSTLGLFNISFQCSMAANDIVLFLWSDLYFSDNVYAIFSVLLLFTIFSSFWFTFCLCGFYYVMLVTFEQTFFMRLKQSISYLVPYMLTSSVLLSLIISVPVAWNITKIDHYGLIQGNLTSVSTAEYSTPSTGFIDGNSSINSTLELNNPYGELLSENLTYNTTLEYSIPQMSLQYLLVTSIIGCCVPLVLVAVANILIVKSLCVHANRLGKTNGGMSVQSVEASVSAARTVTSLLILYVSFYVSQILLIMGVFHAYSLGFSVCLLIIYAYSPIQSIILIFGSPKLKSTVVKILRPTSSNKDRPPNENIKTISS